MSIDGTAGLQLFQRISRSFMSGVMLKAFSFGRLSTTGPLFLGRKKPGRGFLEEARPCDCQLVNLDCVQGIGDSQRLRRSGRCQTLEPVVFSTGRMWGR